MSDADRRLRKRKARERRAASQRLRPIRGQAGRRLRSRSLRPRRVVGVGQFASGLTRPSRKRRGGTVRTWAFTALLVVILVVLVVARLTRHL